MGEVDALPDTAFKIKKKNLYRRHMHSCAFGYPMLQYSNHECYSFLSRLFLAKLHSYTYHNYYTQEIDYSYTV